MDRERRDPSRPVAGGARQEVQHDDAVEAFMQWIDIRGFFTPQALMKALDESSNNQLSRNEFMESMARLGFRNDSRKATDNDACRKIFAAMDLDGSGLVGMKEVRRIFEDPEAIHAEARSGAAVERSRRASLQKTQSRMEAMKDTFKIVNQVRSRIKAASYTTGGTDWQKLFREQDKDHSGNMDWEEFKSMCRKVLKLSEKEADLRAVFRSLDEDNSGEIEIAELIEFVLDPVQRMKGRLKSASWCQTPEDWETLVQMMGTNGSGDMTREDFLKLCRQELSLQDSDEQLEMVFSHVDADGTGTISARELIDFIEQKDPPAVAPAEARRCSTARKSKIEANMQEVAVMVDKMRSRIKGSAYTVGGKDWTKLFTEQDKDQSGMINWKEFLSMCRRVLKLVEPEGQLKMAFKSLDGDGSGEVAVEELVAFVQDPVQRMRLKMQEAVQSQAGSDWVSFLHSQDKDNSGELDWHEFLAMCRKPMCMLDSEVQLRTVFMAIDEDSCGTISMDELVAFVNKQPEPEAPPKTEVREIEQAPDKGFLRVDVEHHCMDNAMHMQYPVERYLQAARTFQAVITDILTEAGISNEVRLNPGPPRGYGSYHGIHGWYQHAKTAQLWMNSRWAVRPPKKILYPRLGSFEVLVRLPNASLRPPGGYKGLPREFEVFSKLKKRCWPKPEEFAKWLGRRLVLARGGDADAIAQLQEAAKPQEVPAAAVVDCATEAKEENEAKYRRPARNPPMWLSLVPRGSPAEPTLPNKTAGRLRAAIKGGVLPSVEAKAGRVPLAMVDQMRARMKAAAYTAGGKDFEKLLRAQDKDHSGQISWPEFRQMCRRVLQINGEDAHLRAIFKTLDFDDSGDIEIDELLTFVQDPLDRMRSRLRAAAQKVAGDDWMAFLEEQDEDGSGQIDFAEFKNMIRGTLKLPDKVEQLRAVFAKLDEDGSGEISLDELVNFISAEPAQAPRPSPPPGRPSSGGSGRSSQRQSLGRPPSGRPSSGGSRSRKEDEGYAPLERLRSRLKGAAYTLGGAQWHGLVREHRTATPGCLDWSEFQALCRGVLRLPDEGEKLRLVFDHLDVGVTTGLIAAEALVGFIASGAVSVEVCMELLGRASWCPGQGHGSG